MRFLKNVAIFMFVVITLLAVTGLLFRPRVTTVERSAVIAAPAEVVFDQVNDLKKADAWSPWKDSTMRVSYGPVTAGKGASSSWTSEQMGSGSQTIEESDPHEHILIHLDFGAMGTAKARWTFAPEGGGVRVTEAMISDAGMNPAKRWMSLMSDKMVGPFFEMGLASLRSVSEAEAARLKAESEAQAAVAADTAAVAVPSANAAPVVPAAKVP